MMPETARSALTTRNGEICRASSAKWDTGVGSPRTPRSVTDFLVPHDATISACPSVVIDIPDCEPHSALVAPRALGDGKVECRVRRVDATAELYLEDGNVFSACAARSGQDWIIYSELSRGPNSALARLRKNSDGTFTLVRQRGSSKPASEEMMHVAHGTHTIDDVCPVTTMTVTIPNSQGTEREVPAGALSRTRSSVNHLPPQVLVSKLPTWDARAESWTLQFNGRCTLASSRNFQLQESAAPAASEKKGPVLLYGKMDQNDFTMDYQQPLSMLQAFAACLSSWAW